MSIAQIIQIAPKEFPHLAAALDCDVSPFHFYIEILISCTISVIFLVSSAGIAFILK